jgi:acyl-CoA reductase-like NAD-dependent aldehyde dehydrogenase
MGTSRDRIKTLFQHHYRQSNQLKGKLASSPQKFTVINPANGELLCTYAILFLTIICVESEHSVDATPSEDIEAAVSHAQATFDSGIWSKASPIHRSSVLSRLADSLHRSIPDMAIIETLQTGRPIREMNAQMARLPDWLSVVKLLRDNAGLTRRVGAILLHLYAPVEDSLLLLKGSCSTTFNAFLLES